MPRRERQNDAGFFSFEMICKGLGAEGDKIAPQEKR